MKLDKKERIILISLLGGFLLLGSVGGFSSIVVFEGLAVLIWVFWRGRAL